MQAEAEQQKMHMRARQREEQNQIHKVDLERQARLKEMRANGEANYEMPKGAPLSKGELKGMLSGGGVISNRMVSAMASDQRLKKAQEQSIELKENLKAQKLSQVK